MKLNVWTGSLVALAFAGLGALVCNIVIGPRVYKGRTIVFRGETIIVQGCPGPVYFQVPTNTSSTGLTQVLCKDDKVVWRHPINNATFSIQFEEPGCTSNQSVPTTSSDASLTAIDINTDLTRVCKYTLTVNNPGNTVQIDPHLIIMK